MLYEPLKPEVHNKYVIKGNDGLLECSVQGHLRPYVTIISWIREPNFVIEDNLRNNHLSGKFILFSSRCCLLSIVLCFKIKHNCTIDFICFSKNNLYFVKVNVNVNIDSNFMLLSKLILIVYSIFRN